MDIRTKRVYEPISEHDGRRILVDRIWPRGLTKAQVGVDCWLKDVAPSSELRKWFGHDRLKWGQFRARYHSELDDKKAALETLVDEGTRGRLTLLFSARDTECNQAVALREFLLSRF